MLHVVISALMALAPHLGHHKIKEYSDLIIFESGWYKMPPLLVVAFIHKESRWNPRKKSVTNDFGLMQVHVARRGSARFLGREKELYRPRTNIREGTRILAMWEGYHNKWCGKNPDHPFWAHQKWGRKVKDTRPSGVTRLFEELKARFEPKMVGSADEAPGAKERKVSLLAGGGL